VPEITLSLGSPGFRTALEDVGFRV